MSDFFASIDTHPRGFSPSLAGSGFEHVLQANSFSSQNGRLTSPVRPTSPPAAHINPSASTARAEQTIAMSTMGQSQSRPSVVPATQNQENNQGFFSKFWDKHPAQTVFYGITLATAALVLPFYFIMDAVDKPD
jgi:hypothetical protein